MMPADPTSQPSGSHIDPEDLLTARLVMAVGVLMNLLDCLDELGIEVRGAANKEAEAILQSLGPAAVTCALLQGSETLRRGSHAENAVNLFVQASLRRRESFLAAFPRPQRLAIERQEATQQCSAERVLQLFAEALAGMKKTDVLQRWGSKGGLEQLSSAVASASRGEEVDLQALEELAAIHAGNDHEDGAGDPGDEVSAGSAQSEVLPEELLQVVGGVLAGVGADAHMLDRVLAGVIAVPSVPQGYDADSSGTVRRSAERVGRNDPCPCGSGRKFKKCCGP